MTSYVGEASQKTKVGAVVDGLVAALTARIKETLPDEDALRKELKSIINDITDLGSDNVLKENPKALIPYAEKILCALIEAVDGHTIKELDVVKTVVRTLIHEAYEIGKGSN